jgi:transcriptional regulator with XRE-family HTH domain
MIDARDGLGNCVGRMLFLRGLTDDELADRVGLSRAQLNRIRNGRAVPRVRTAIALAEALQCRVRDLFHLVKPRARRFAPRAAG